MNLRMGLVIGVVLLQGAGRAAAGEVEEPSYEVPSIEVLDEDQVRSPHDESTMEDGWLSGLYKAEIAVTGKPWIGLKTHATATAEWPWTAEVDHPEVLRRGSRSAKVHCSGTHASGTNYVLYSMCQIVFKGRYDTSGPIDSLLLFDINAAYDQFGNRHEQIVRVTAGDQTSVSGELGVEAEGPGATKLVGNVGFERDALAKPKDRWNRKVNVFGAHVVGCGQTVVLDQNKTTHEPSIMLEAGGGIAQPKAQFTAITLHFLAIYDLWVRDPGDPNPLPNSGPSTPPGDGGGGPTTSDDYPGSSPPATGHGSSPPSGPLDPSNPFIPDEFRDPESPNRGIGGELQASYGPNPISEALESGAVLNVPAKWTVDRDITASIAFFYDIESPETVTLASAGVAASFPTSITRLPGEGFVEFPIAPTQVGELVMTALFDDGSESSDVVAVQSLPSEPGISVSRKSVKLLSGSGPWELTVMRSYFVDFDTEDTVVSISTSDASSVLGGVPASLTIASGEFAATIAIESTGSKGVAGLSLSSGMETADVEIEFIEVGDIDFDVYDREVPVGATSQHRIPMSGVTLSSALPVDVEVVAGGGYVTTSNPRMSSSFSDGVYVDITGTAVGTATLRLVVDEIVIGEFDVTVMDETP